MLNIPYAKFNQEELILRDYLATDRTVLANERTFLAYVRTALTLLVVGITLTKIFATFWINLVGSILIISGLMTFILGLIRYANMNRLIKSAQKNS